MIRIIIVFLISFYTISILGGCGKTCVEATYYFDMTERFYPEKDSIKIGDTLWVASSHSTTFRDTRTGNDIDYSSSTLGLNIECLNFTDTAILNSGNPGTFHSFTTIVIDGTEIGNDNLPDQNKGVNFKKSNDSFILKVAFIPKEKGIYSIGLNNAGAVRLNDGCEFAVANVVNVNDDNHLHYYQRLFPDSTISDYERTHIYCFKVY